MTELVGYYMIDGKPVLWRRNPVTGGWFIDLSTNTIQLAGEPSELAANIALAAYQQGVLHGQNLGRAILQNDFRNLMGLQR